MSNAARQATDTLVDLPSDLLCCSGNIADVIETLEITDLLHEQFHESAIITHSIRHTPRLSRARDACSTVRTYGAITQATDLGNLRRLDRIDLHELGSIILQQRKDQLSSGPKVRKSISATQSRPSESLPLVTPTLSDNDGHRMGDLGAESNRRVERSHHQR